MIEDQVGLRLVASADGWRCRGDMHPQATRGFRAGIVARDAGFGDARHVSAAMLNQRYSPAEPTACGPRARSCWWPPSEIHPLTAVTR
jgi:hypothetical protein